MPRQNKCMRIARNLAPGLVRSLSQSMAAVSRSLRGDRQVPTPVSLNTATLEVDLADVISKVKVPTSPPISTTSSVNKNDTGFGFSRLSSRLRYAGRPHVGLYVITFLAFAAFLASVSVIDSNTVTMSQYQNSEEKVLLLLYTGHRGQRDWGLGPGDSLFEHLNCPVKTCAFTTDTGLMDDAPVVLFHVPELKTNLAPPPRSRYRQQAWVFYTHDSPAHSHQPPYLWQHLFNWSMTYHPEAELHFPYGRVYLQTAENPKNYLIVAKEERKMVAWLPDSCKTPSKREAYIDRLKKVVPVDTFGECGDHECDKTESCIQVVGKSYKFYLSFESSFCEQFISAEFFRHATMNIVPIVRGGANYSAFAPKNSYINSQDFSSPEELGRYLNFLSSNPEEYAKYLEWKNYYVVEVTDRKDGVWCKLCATAHDLTSLKRRHNPYEFWFHGKSCWAPNDV